MDIPFAKYQALGNSFIVLDRIEKRGRSKRFERLARKICNPVYGVGADGLLLISRPTGGFRVDIYNADGSWAEKSGNGVRIAAMHLLNWRHIRGGQVRLLTGSGKSDVAFHQGNRIKRIISASLGKPVFEAALIPVTTRHRFFINQPVRVYGKKPRASAVSVGNPHLVLFCRDFDFEWEPIGRALEIDPMFPHRINVGFVAVRDRKNIEVRDWERGAGPTLSSGTGAAAAVAVAIMRGLTEHAVKVRTRAGVLQVKWDRKRDEIIIKGPVEFIGTGIYQYR